MASFDQSKSRGSGTSSNWRRMRAPCREDFQQSLQRRNSLTLHGWVIGLFMMSFMWAMSRFQWMFLGDGSLALRYLVTLGSGYLVYLLVLHEWTKWILLKQEHEGTDIDAGDAFDIADAVSPRPLLEQYAKMECGHSLATVEALGSLCATLADMNHLLTSLQPSSPGALSLPVFHDDVPYQSR